LKVRVAVHEQHGPASSRAERARLGASTCAGDNQGGLDHDHEAARVERRTARLEASEVALAPHCTWRRSR
jgi:hypothetical protein